MYFLREMYQGTGHDLLPHVDTLESMYDILTKFPDKDEARFFSVAAHQLAADEGNRDKAVTLLLSDLFNWMKLFFYTNAFKARKLLDGLVHAHNTKNYLVWALLSRSTMEYSAVLYYFKRKMDQYEVKGPLLMASKLQALEDVVLQFAHGTRLNWTDLLKGDVVALKKSIGSAADEPSAVNVLTALSHLSKRDSRFTDVAVFYAMLSDFAHPNMASHSCVIDPPGGSTTEIHECVLRLNPVKTRGDFILALSLPTVALHFSNIVELLIEVSGTLNELLQVLDGTVPVTIDFSA
jgi:hypothetical protein